MLLVSSTDKAIRKVRSIESRRILFSNNSWHGIDFNQDSFRPWAMGCNLLMRHFTGKRKRSATVIDILFYEEPYRQHYLCVLNAPSRWHLLRLGHKKPIKEWNWVIASLFVNVWIPCIHKTLLYSHVCVIRAREPFGPSEMLVELLFIVFERDETSHQPRVVDTDYLLKHWFPNCCMSQCENESSKPCLHGGSDWKTLDKSGYELWLGCSVCGGYFRLLEIWVSDNTNLIKQTRFDMIVKCAFCHTLSFKKYNLEHVSSAKCGLAWPFI